MKKLAVASMAIVVALLAWSLISPSYDQEGAKEEKPTFYHLVPGTYVNGWPRATVHYPKEWVERLPMPQEIFRASAPGPVPFPALMVTPFPNPQFSLEAFASAIANSLRAIATDVTVVSDKPSRLRDGSPAREIEIHMILNGAPHHVIDVVTKKDDLWISNAVESQNGRIGEDLKGILYSIEFQPGKDERMKPPPNVQEFLNGYCSDMVSHDLAKVMTHYSDRYLNSGRTKGERERFYRQVFGSITSFEMVITDFVAAGEKAHLTGFVITNLGTIPITDTSITKENGEWKWYGNQRDVSP